MKINGIVRLIYSNLPTLRVKYNFGHAFRTLGTPLVWVPGRDASLYNRIQLMRSLR